MINLFSQTVEFTYDNNGNRLNRTIQTEQLRSNTVKFPVVNPKSLKALDAMGTALESGITSKNEEVKGTKGNEDVTRESIKQENKEIVTLVYPNPNKGLLKIDISNMPLNSVSEMKLYDLAGIEKTSKRNFESYSEIDISQFKDGIYILRIKINTKIFDWKIIKNTADSK